MLQTPSPPPPKKKRVSLHPYLLSSHNDHPLQQPLSSVPKVAVMERFNCSFLILFWVCWWLNVNYVFPQKYKFGGSLLGGLIIHPAHNESLFVIKKEPLKGMIDWYNSNRIFLVAIIINSIIKSYHCQLQMHCKCICKCMTLMNNIFTPVPWTWNFCNQ